MWIIYKHTNKINNKSYIGQTCQSTNDRWRNGEGYKHSPKFYHAINKYGWDSFEHEILEKNILTRELADKKEKEFIKLYNSIENGYNIHKGGTGFTQDKAKQYIKQNWENGTLKRIFCKKVICINTQKIYDSIKEASEETGINKSSISNCCRHKTKSAGVDKEGNRLVWAFYQEGKKYEYHKPLHNSSKKVICLTTNEIFDTIEEGSKKYNISHTGIIKCCKGQQKTAGQLKDGTRLVWRYFNQEGIYKNEVHTCGTSAKKVICLETNKIYNSLKEASEDIGVAPNNIGNCCRGKTKTSGGYHWKFYDENGEITIENERGKN